MNTLTVRNVDGGDVEIPIAIAFAGSQPINDFAPAERPPEQCAHAGARHSANLSLYCPHCGARLFLPTHNLAYRPAEEIEAMHDLWVAAGWPEYIAGRWLVDPERWTMVAHPWFVGLGGIPVRNANLPAFEAIADRFASPER